MCSVAFTCRVNDFLNELVYESNSEISMGRIYHYNKEKDLSIWVSEKWTRFREMEMNIKFERVELLKKVRIAVFNEAWEGSRVWICLQDSRNMTSKHIHISHYSNNG